MALWELLPTLFAVAFSASSLWKVPAPGPAARG